MYEGICVIKEFDKWDEFYGKDKKVAIDDFSMYPNMGVVLKSRNW